MISRDEYRQMLMAGTVTFPATFPQVGIIELSMEKLPSRQLEPMAFIVVTERPSARVVLSRRVLARSVRAVFIPRQSSNVNYGEGTWLLGDEITSELKRLSELANRPIVGIVFVAESEPSLLKVSAGMTAAESVQYYPPLPSDPSNNHYNPWPRAGGTAFDLSSFEINTLASLDSDTSLVACDLDPFSSCDLDPFSSCDLTPFHRVT